MPSTEAPRLSVVIPAYNEEQRLPRTLETLRRYLESRPETSEILVVDDGSRDSTREVVQRFAAERSDPPLDPGPPGQVSATREPAPAPCPVRLLAPGRQGKGGAVRSGMLAAEGDFILMTDADLCTPIEDVDLLLRALQEGGDVAIGSRAAPGAVLEVRQPRHRELLGRAGNLIIQATLLPGIRDTQCGFKLFRREAARDIFSRSVMDDISFDVEVLYLARRLGYGIREVPIHWSHIPGSKMRLARESRSMLRDLIRIRWLHGRIQPVATTAEAGAKSRR